MRICTTEKSPCICKRISSSTRGNDIYFRPGVYEQGTPEGTALHGHELVHVGQYRLGMNVASYLRSTRDGYRNSPYEQQAHALERTILRKVTKP